MGEVHEQYLLCSQEEPADFAVPHYHSPCLSGRTAPPVHSSVAARILRRRSSQAFFSASTLV